MVEGLIGKKIGITQSFDEQGNVFSVTVILVGPCTVFQKKTEKKDGYSSIQIGFIEEKGRKKPNKPLTGHSEKAGVPPPKILREFRFIEQAEVKVGDQFFVVSLKKEKKSISRDVAKAKGLQVSSNAGGIMAARQVMVLCFIDVLVQSEHRHTHPVLSKEKNFQGIWVMTK